MLKNTTRSELTKHSLLYLQKHTTNPSQYWNRLKETCLKGIRDLTLVASKCPDEKLREVFNEETLNKLLLNIFISYSGEDLSDTRKPNVKLSSFFANEGIKVCIREFKRWKEDVPETSQPTVDYLYKATDICREIAYKSTLNLIGNETPVKSRPFIWEEITSTRQRSKFDNYILNHDGFKFDDDPSLNFFVLLKESNHIKKEYDLYQSFDPLEDDYDGSNEDVIFLGHVYVTLDPDKNKGKISYYNNELKETKTEEITLKKYGSFFIGSIKLILYELQYSVKYLCFSFFSSFVKRLYFFLLLLSHPNL